MDTIEDGHRVKRFKHQSYHASLKDVHLPSPLNQSELDRDIADNASHFHEALEHWRQLNLSQAFLQFANKAEGLSASMPLLLHHWKDVVDLWTIALDCSDDEALSAILDLMQKLAHDLRTTLLPVYSNLLTRLLALLSRALPAQALTAVLATLSSLFKHILIPSLDVNLLRDTWSSFRTCLTKCNPEIQRAAAEVWGSVLRKLKSSQRDRCIELIFESLQGVEDACAWSFVFACKSVAQTLHTCTPNITNALLTHHLTYSDPNVTHTLLQRVFTALTHHCHNADQFSPLADCIVERFCSISEEVRISGDCGPDRLRRTLEICAIVCGVRRGSRLTQNHLAKLLSHTMLLPFADLTLRPAILKVTTAILIAGDMSLWMGPGRKFLECAWQNDTMFALLLSGSLADMDWGGWKLIALPHVLKLIPQLLHSEDSGVNRYAIRLMASLSEDGKLESGERAWKEGLGAWVIQRLDTWEIGTSEQRDFELRDLLSLSAIVPSISVTSSLSRIITNAIQTPEPKDDYNKTPANSAWILGACMRTLSKMDLSIASDELDLTQWIIIGVGKWGWSTDVLGGLAALACLSKGGKHLDFQALLPSLQDALISQSHSLRLSALRLLTSPLIASSPGVEEILKRCLQGEEVPLDVQGVRERVLRIGRVCQVVKDDDDQSADICVRWLISQLKVNLRPVWSPAAGALSTLSQRFGNIVWRLLFSDLVGLQQRPQDADHPPWMAIDSDSEDDEKSKREDERSWRDPSAHQLRTVVAKWMRDNVSCQKIVQAQISQDRLDRGTFEMQLLHTLCECPALAQQHGRELVPVFLSIAGPDAPAKPARQKLSSWLTLFSKFSNPKALYATEALYSLYTSLLSHPDRTLQSASFACVLTYKSPHLAPRETTFRMLLDDTKWRDELATLDISSFEPQDRPELVPMLVRLFFGLILEKQGRSRGADRRVALLSALGGCTDQELELLVDLMMQPIETIRNNDNVLFDLHSIPNHVTEKQQIGFLTLLGDVLKHLGSRLSACWPRLLSMTLSITGQAQRRLEASMHVVDDPDDGGEEEDADEPDSSPGSSKSTRTVRQLGFKRIADFFRSPFAFNFEPYMSVVFKSLISPRLAMLDKENTQSPSSLLELFYVWTEREETVTFLVDYDSRVLPKIYDCLVAVNVKPPVLSRVFDIVEHVLGHSSDSATISDLVIKPHVSILLTHLATLMDKTKGINSMANPLVQRQVGILSQLASFLEDGAQASLLLTLLIPLLRKPPKMVSEKVKVDLLKIMCDLLALIPELSDDSSKTYHNVYDVIAQLFQTLRSRPARCALLVVFQRLARINEAIQPLAELLDSLNAYSVKHLDEPDFDRRLAAFAALNEQSYSSLSARDWLPVLYNMLHCIQDANELAVRNNASFALRRFLDVLANTANPDFESIFLRVLFPGLKNGLRSRTEPVRAEVLGVFAYAVTKCESIALLREMRVLLAGGDEEANFFNNIHHIQVHRRTRALRRLAEHCDEGHLRSTTLAEIFLPLVGNFIQAAGSTDHLLVNEAITTTGRMAKHLAWGAYNTLVQQYLKLSKEKGNLERVHVRTLVAILDSFHFCMHDIATEAFDQGDNASEQDDATDAADLPAVSNLTQNTTTTLIADSVNKRLLPNLLQYLEKRDETDDNIRIPISIGIVKVAQHLPEATREPQISRLLTILSQVLRSKSQDTRDLTRETLCRIAVTLGPTFLPSILREMRAALLRGPQLHVLAHVTHSLMVLVTSPDHVAEFSNLDDCVADVAHVSAEVVFGQSGKDVQSEDFKTKMREVRGSSAKGLDSFALIAKYITPPRISSLLVPVRSIMQETESLKTMQLVEDLLRRVAGGLNGNQHFTPAELLVLCHTLITQNARFLQQGSLPTKVKGKVNHDAIVQMKRRFTSDADHYANNSFRFVTFGLDLLITAFRRSRFDFHDSIIVSRLEPMVAVIGNTLYSSNMQVASLGLKASAALVKCPLKAIGKTLPVFIRQTLNIIKQAGSTEPEIVQTAFRALATIIRDCPTAEVKEKDLTFLLELLAPDLEDTARQGSIFALLRGIVSRKFVVPEIYDLMDKVSEIMVTNQSSQVQELCRGVLLQFLLDYPQGKGRLREQMTFLATNLSYVYESGRKSVMELLSAVFSKFETGLISEYADLFFVALVMVVANDDSPKCREMAAELLKNLLSHLDDDHRRVVTSHLHSWATQQAKPQLERVACQVYGLLVDTLKSDAQPYLTTILEDLNTTLVRSARQQRLFEVEDDAMDVELEWQLPYHALISITKTLRVFPDNTTQMNKLPWGSIVAHLLFPHAWVRTAACRLLGSLFTAVPVSTPQSNVPDEWPLSLTGMEDVAKKLCTQLKSDNLDEGLSLQVVKNLFYIGKCFSVLPLSMEPGTLQADQDDVDEEPAEETRAIKRNPLSWLFSKLSYQARAALIARRNRLSTSNGWAHQQLSIIRWFAAMAAHIPAAQLESFLIHILSPVYRITEDDTIRDPHMDELKTLAQELQELVQTKVGTTKFSEVYSRIRQTVLGVRKARKTARVLQVATNPEAAAKRKMQKNQVKRASRKRKNRAFADGKIVSTPAKRRREE